MSLQDGKNLQAIEITPETMDVYLDHKAKVHHVIEDIVGAALVHDKDNPQDWGWYPAEYFKELFEFQGEPDETGFRTVVVKDPAKL